MTIEEQLKREILSKYKSVRAFTTAIGIPYSTLDSVFKRGISNAGVSTMIKIFNALDLDIESIKGDTLLTKDISTKKSPSTAEAAPGEGRISMEESYRLLISLGLIEDGQDLSDDDLAFLEHVIGLLDAWFRKGH